MEPLHLLHCCYYQQGLFLNSNPGFKPQNNNLCVPGHPSEVIFNPLPSKTKNPNSQWGKERKEQHSPELPHPTLIKTGPRAGLASSKQTACLCIKDMHCHNFSEEISTCLYMSFCNHLNFYNWRVPCVDMFIILFSFSIEYIYLFCH